MGCIALLGTDEPQEEHNILEMKDGEIGASNKGSLRCPTCTVGFFFVTDMNFLKSNYMNGISINKTPEIAEEETPKACSISDNSIRISLFRNVTTKFDVISMLYSRVFESISPTCYHLKTHFGAVCILYK